MSDIYRASERIKPTFGKNTSLEPEDKNNNSLGCIGMFLLSIIVYFVLSAINKVTSGGGDKFDQFICYGTLIVVLFVFARYIDQERNAREEQEAEKQKWKNACVLAEVAIVDRNYSHGGNSGNNDDGYEIQFYKPHYHLYLEMNADQRSIIPSKTVAFIKVDRYIYEKLEGHNIARIYYKPEAPLTFMLEEEL